MGNEASDSPKSIYSLCMASWTRGYAAVLLDLPQGEGPWMLQSVAAANSAVIIARPTLSDMAGVQHLLKLLLEKMGQSLRISREFIYLVINQSIREKSSFTAAQFFSELAQESPWVPPVVANIPFLPEVIQVQDKRMPPFGAVDDFSAGVRRITDALFPGIDIGRDASRDGGKSGVEDRPDSDQIERQPPMNCKPGSISDLFDDKSAPAASGKSGADATLAVENEVIDQVTKEFAASVLQDPSAEDRQRVTERIASLTSVAVRKKAAVPSVFGGIRDRRGSWRSGFWGSGSWTTCCRPRGPTFRRSPSTPTAWCR